MPQPGFYPSQLGHDRRPTRVLDDDLLWADQLLHACFGSRRTNLALGGAADASGRALGGTGLVRLAVEAAGCVSGSLCPQLLNALDEQEQVACQERTTECGGTLGSSAVGDVGHEWQVLVDSVGVACKVPLSAFTSISVATEQANGRGGDTCWQSK
jgi:hypothetical protein